MDFAKIMQMMNSMNGGGGGNKDMAMLMQLLPTMMNGNSTPSSKQPTPITLNADEVNKSIFKLYQDEK